MKKNIYVIALFLITFFYKAQTWQWAKSIDGGYSEGVCASTDATGNVFVTGTYTGQPTLPGYTLSGVGVNNYVYLVKYDLNGNVLWARNSISTSTVPGKSVGMSVSTDATGNVFVAGYFYSSDIAFGSFTLTQSGADNSFLVKYDANGNVLWAKKSIGTGSNKAVSVSSDPSGNAIVTGYYNSPTVSFGTFTLSNTGSENIFIVKYDASGNEIWAQSSVGSSQDESTYLDADQNGNLFVTGYFTSPTITFGTFTLTNSGTQDLFLVKLSPNGTVLWVRNAISFAVDGANAVCSDANGNVYLTGYYGGSSVFGTYTLTGGGSTFFLAKYDASGTVLWARTASGTSNAGLSISTYTGGLLVAGAMDQAGSSMTLGTFTLNPPVGYFDPAFVAHYDHSGNVLSVNVLSSGGDDWLSVSTDGFCNVYVTGDFFVPTFVIGTTTLTQTGYENTFTAKYSYPCNIIPEYTNELNGINSKINLYPNPNNGSFNVQIDHEIQNGSLVLINSLGQKISEQKIIQGMNSITNTELSNGLYHYMIYNHGESISSGKLMIE